MEGHLYCFLPNHFAASGRLCGQPGQQQGRRFPRNKSSCNRTRCSFLVSGFLTIVTQQIHSLRANGVSPFHRAEIFLLESRTSFTSCGSLCRKSVVLVAGIIQIVPRSDWSRSTPDFSFHMFTLALRLVCYSNSEEPLSDSRSNTSCPSSFIK